jgi:hypothetical protein
LFVNSPLLIYAKPVGSVQRHVSPIATPWQYTQNMCGVCQAQHGLGLRCRSWRISFPFNCFRNRLPYPDIVAVFDDLMTSYGLQINVPCILISPWIYLLEIAGPWTYLLSISVLLWFSCGPVTALFELYY